MTGWAPTSDGLGLVANSCTGQKYVGYEMVTPPNADNNNDEAMRRLRNGEVDAMWVYADQAYSYDCAKLGADVTPEWDCALWAGFGTEYAYIATGMFGHAYNGTTIALSRKGSGVTDIINPCLKEFMKTKEYYDICEKRGFLLSCYPNEHFKKKSDKLKEWEKKTKDHPAGCASGYCGCKDA